MRNIFVPNGTASSEIIYRLARKEFGNSIRKNNNYSLLKYDIVQVLKKMKSDELEENRLDTLIGIEHLKQNDFGNFISVRFAYWALIISIAAMVIGETPIYHYFNMSKQHFAYLIIALLTILLIVTARTIHIQNDELEYLNFKLICFEEVDKAKKK